MHRHMHGKFIKEFCGHRFERVEFIQAAMNISQKYLALHNFFLLLHSPIRHSSIFFLPLFLFLHNLAVRFDYYLWYFPVFISLYICFALIRVQEKHWMCPCDAFNFPDEGSPYWVQKKNHGSNKKCTVMKLEILRSIENTWSRVNVWERESKWIHEEQKKNEWALDIERNEWSGVFGFFFHFVSILWSNILENPRFV